LPDSFKTFSGCGTETGKIGRAHYTTDRKMIKGRQKVFKQNPLPIRIAIMRSLPVWSNF